MIPICGKRADLNICVSHFTESRVHELLGLENTKVIHEGIESTFTPVSINEQTFALDTYKINQPFIFYIGSFSPRKNIARLIRSFLSVKEILPTHTLVLAGGYSWNDKNVRKL